MPGVFISYRRQDSAGYAGRLFDILSSRIGAEHTFMDIDDIEGGDKFSAVIDQRIDSSNVLLAIIGSDWLTIADQDGNRRLDNPQDFVRVEIGKALKGGIRVIPVLVGGAKIPGVHELPDDLRPLSERHAMEIRDSDFHVDSQQLADLVLKTVPLAGVRPEQKKLQRFSPALVWGAIAAMLVISSGLAFRHFRPVTPRVAHLTGRWNATVKYDWGHTHSEIFDFAVDRGDLSGTAGFLGVGRAIMDGKVEGTRVSFTTTLVPMNSSEQGVQKRYYKGTIAGDTIQFALVTDSRVSSHPTIYFVATKLK